MSNPTAPDAPFWCPRCGEHNIEKADQHICDTCAGEVEEENSREREQAAYDDEVNRRISAWKEDGMPLRSMRRRP